MKQATPMVEGDFDQATLPEEPGTVEAEETAQPEPMFSGVSAKAAARAKKGTTSSSRTGRAKQATFSFGKPKKTVYVKVHPSPAYTMPNVPVYENELTGTFHFVKPALYESDELPERFLRACKTIDIFTTGAADGLRRARARIRATSSVNAKGFPR